MYPLLLKELFGKVGFGWGVRIIALMCAVCCGIGFLTVTKKLPPPPPQDGGSEVSSKSEKPEEGRAEAARGSVLTRALKDRTFVLVVIGSVFISFGGSLVCLFQITKEINIVIT